MAFRYFVGKRASWCRHLVAVGVLALKLGENFDAYRRERPSQAALRRAFALGFSGACIAGVLRAPGPG